MDFGDSLITAFVILLFSVMITVFPLLITANFMDDASQATLQAQTTDFVNEICNTGKITKANFDKFEENINSPNTYNIEIDVKVLDETPNKQITMNNSNNIGENVYITYYTSQILEQLDDPNKGRYFNAKRRRPSTCFYSKL